MNDGSTTTTYAYDSANQLVGVTTSDNSYTASYSYDASGNILSKTVNGVTTPYSYTDNEWKDLLTAYDGNTITYDGVGNPLSDGEWTYNWKNGRELAAMTDGETTWTYTYDANGMRTSRSNGSTTYSYVYNGGQLVQLRIDRPNATVLNITYDADGRPFTIENGHEMCYYVVNLQGDVIGIQNIEGEMVTTYTYDAWGNVHINGSSQIGDVNPLLYRGYVYDYETGLYYVSSRYYDPEIGRFISPDTTDVLTATPMELTDKNLYAYCDNNPVMREDKGGQFWNIIAGAVIGGGLELAGQLLSGKSLSEVNWAKVGVSAVSCGLTAAVGPVAGCLISGATDVAMDALDGNINSVADAAKSFAWGTAKAAVSYGVGTAVGKATKSLTKVEKVGKIGDGGYPGVKYSYNKGQGRAVRSIELHPNHNNHGIHLQGNKWNPKTGTRSGVFFRKTLWR